MYAYDGDGPAPRLTTDPAITKVGHFPIRMPRLEGVKPGDKVSLTIRMYFGLTEIKIECAIQDQVFVFTSAFDAADACSIGTPMLHHQQPQQAINNYASPSMGIQAMSSAYGYAQPQPYPANIIPTPPLYNNNSNSNLSYSGSINNPDYYSQQPSRHSYTPQQQQQSSQAYPPQGYYNTNNNGGEYPPTNYNNSNNFTH